MKTQTQKYNDVTVIELQGEFTEEFTREFQNNLSTLISERCQGVVIDMTSVSFLDSKALECLLWLTDYCHENMTQLKIAGLDENCRKILEITRLLQKFDTYSELSEAVKSFV